MRRTFALLLAALLLILLPAEEASAQDEMNARFGVGTGAVVSTQNGVGLLATGRVSAPITMDVSAAVDLGISGFILGGTRDAAYVFNPQISGIVNLPMAETYMPYLMGGVGAHVPITGVDDTISGPVLHLGYGRVHPLQDTSLFYEINPGLLVSADRIDILLPVRIGLIFR